MLQRLSNVMPALGIVFLSALVAALSIFPLQESDVFMYMAIVRDFLGTGHWPVQDPFSFSAVSKDWAVFHEWASYFYFYFAHRLFGVDGLILAKTALVAATFFLPLSLVERKEQAAVFCFFGALAVFGASTRFVERASLFGDLFFVALLCVLLASRRKDTRAVFLVPFIFLLWVNFHASFPAGIALCFLRLIADFRGRRTRNYRIFALMTAAGIIALILNPRGWHGVAYPFQFAFREAAFLKANNPEWMPVWNPIVSRYWQFKVFAVETGMTALILFWRFRKKDAFEVAAFGLLAYLGLTSTRFVPLASIGYVALAVSVAGTRDLGIYRRLSFAAGIAAVGAAAVALGFLFEGRFFNGYDLQRIGLGLDKRYLPVESVEYIDTSLPSVNVFNSHWLGCYLAWKWQVRRKVFYHGFSTDFDFTRDDYLAIIRSPEDFERIVKKYDIKAFLIGKRLGFPQLADLLSRIPHWKLAFQDEAAYVFVFNP